MLAPPKEKGSRLRTPSPRLHRRKLSATCEVKERETRKQVLEWGEEVRDLFVNAFHPINFLALSWHKK